MISALCSLLVSAFFGPLILIVIVRSALRTSHFELCIRPSTPLPTASTLCGTILGPNYCLLRPSHLDCDCLSLLASLCALPSSLLGPDPFLYHPALLGPNHLSSLFSLLFSLFSRCCSFPRSHFATATSICASGHRLRAKLLRPFAAPMQTRESANPVAVQLQCSCSLFLQGFDGGCSSRPPPPPQQTLWGPLAASWVVLRFPRWLFCLSWAEPESIVSFAAVAVCGAFSVLLSWNLASGHRRRPQLLRPFAAPTNPAVSQFGDLWRPFL